MAFVAEIDKFLSESRNAGYKKNLEANYGYTGEMTDEVYEKVAGNLNAWMGDRGNAKFEEWKKTKDEAKALREESQKMITEAEQAQADLTTYEEKLAEQMGLTQAEVIAGKERIDELKAAIDSLPSDVYTRYHVTEDDYTGHAIGADYIPYDNYPALLHRGEKVLTAKEARQQSSQGANMEHLEERIAAAIRSGMQGVTVESFIDGKRMTDDSNRRNMRDIKARRYRG